MKAIVINQFGNPEVLELRSDTPPPSIQNNQVLIKVHSAGINPLDWKIRKGELRFLLGAKFPIILGNDVSGVIMDVGKSVKNYKIGDEVYCLLDASPKPSLTGFAISGAYAEIAVTREDTLSLKPHLMTHQEAASVPLAALTAYQTLRYKAKIKKGDKVLINGASGGVGIFATQIAKAAGGKVTAICSKRNQELVCSLGADATFDYKKQNITELIEKFNIIYDVAVNLSFSKCRKILAKNGVFISNLANPLNILSNTLYPAFKFMGFKKKNTFAWVKSSGEDLKTITKMIENGELRTVIDRIYSMDEIQEAHIYSQSGRVRGKIVIDINTN